jgi:hypothetical protein
MTGVKEPPAGRQDNQPDRECLAPVTRWRLLPG